MLSQRLNFINFIKVFKVKKCLAKKDEDKINNSISETKNPNNIKFTIILYLI